MAKKTQNKISQVKSKIISLWGQCKKLAQAHPMASFGGFLGLLLISIIAGNALRAPKNGVTNTAITPKEVQVFVVGDAPRVTASGKIEKTGVVTLTAQTAGIVQRLNVLDGSRVSRGTRILSLASTYQGSNLTSLGRALANRNYTYILDTYDTQKNIIQKNRDVANAGATQASSMRDIARKSIDETNGLINLDQDILNSLDANINQLQATNVGGVNDATILQTKQAKMSILGALNGLRSALRTTQYTSDETKEAATMSNLGKETALKQLDIQEKALELNRDLAKLNLQIAQVNESFMFPQSPCSGVVERIQVRFGQSVVPGIPLANIRCDSGSTSVVALVSGDIARTVSRATPTRITLDGKDIDLLPRSISLEPTNGMLHSIVYSLPEQLTGHLTDGSFVPLRLPIGIEVTSTDPAIPLDSVYQTENNAFVFVVTQKNGKKIATTKEVKLGSVVGEYINVEGIEKNEQIILDRTITQGDEIK